MKPINLIDKIERRKVLRRINTINVFDFDYSPSENDQLELNYEGENEEGEDEEFTGKLKDCLKKFNISSFKKEWKLEELVQNWDGYEDYIFNDSESDESYDDIFGEY